MTTYVTAAELAAARKAIRNEIAAAKLTGPAGPAGPPGPQGPAGGTTPPVVVPPVVQPTGTVLFSSPGLVSDFDLEGSGTGKILQGPGYIETQLTGTGPLTGERAEYDFPASAHLLPGKTIRDEFEHYAVPGHVIWPSNGMHNLIWQAKSEGEGSPYLALYLWQRGSDGAHGIWTNVAGVNTFRTVYTEGVWHKIVTETKGAEDATGSFKLWVDGVPLAVISNQQTIVTGEKDIHIKHGNYRNHELSGDGFYRTRNHLATQLP